MVGSLFMRCQGGQLLRIMGWKGGGKGGISILVFLIYWPYISSLAFVQLALLQYTVSVPELKQI